MEGNTSIWNSIKAISSIFNRFKITTLRFLNSGEELFVQRLLGWYKKWYVLIANYGIIVVVQSDIPDEVLSWFVIDDGTQNSTTIGIYLLTNPIISSQIRRVLLTAIHTFIQIPLQRIASGGFSRNRLQCSRVYFETGGIDQWKVIEDIRISSIFKNWAFRKLVSGYSFDEVGKNEANDRCHDLTAVGTGLFAL